MGIVAVLLDKAQERRSIPSDNALREVFGVTRQTVSKWRLGEAYPSQDHIAQLAEMAGENPAAWLVAVQAERENGRAGAYWAKLAREMGRAAVLAALVFTSWNLPVLSIMSTLRRLFSVHSRLSPA